jgi:hypothetical protein
MGVATLSFIPPNLILFKHPVTFGFDTFCQELQVTCQIIHSEPQAPNSMSREELLVLPFLHMYRDKVVGGQLKEKVETLRVQSFIYS